MSLLWSHLIAWPSNGGCSLAGPTFSANQAEDLGSDSLCLSTVFLWLTGNKLLDVDHCADYRPHNIVSPVIVLEALSRRPPVIMTFDKLPINNRVICDSRLFGGPRSEMGHSALGTGIRRVRCEGREYGHQSVDWTPLIWNISLKNNPLEWGSILILRWSELRVIP